MDELEVKQKGKFAALLVPCPGDAHLQAIGWDLYLQLWAALFAGLADPKAVVSRCTAHDKKEVLSPLQVTEFNNTGDEPHYYSSTGNLQVREIRRHTFS